MDSVTLVCLAGHENPVSNEFCTICGSKLPPPLGPELFKRLSNLPDYVQVAVFAWFISDLYTEDVCTLYGWFNYEPLGERKKHRVN